MIETERLVLRNWKDEDAEQLFEWAKDPEVGPPAGWPPHTNVEGSLWTIKNVLNSHECYAICEKGTDIPIGAVELILNGESPQTKGDDECELGYWLAKPFWGRGYMPEAAKALMKHGFEELGMNIIWCAYYGGNTKSKRTQEKLGFVFHHADMGVEVSLLNEVRDNYVNIMTKDNWLALQNS